MEEVLLLYYIEYPFLLKTEKKGDLRKDSRLMDFSLLVL